MILLISQPERVFYLCLEIPQGMGMNEEEIIRRILDGCRRFVPVAEREYGIYDADIRMSLDEEGNYVLKVRVEGTHGEASYKTPMFKRMDIERGWIEEHDIEEFIDFCTRVVRRLSDLVTRD